MLTLHQVVLKGSSTENQSHLRRDALQSLRRHRLVILDLVSAESRQCELASGSPLSKSQSVADPSSSTQTPHLRCLNQALSAV